MKKIEIPLPGRAYPIYIGTRTLELGLLEILRLAPNRRAAVVADETVWRLHGARLCGLLAGRGIRFDPILIPPGEASKSTDWLNRLYHEFFARNLTRADPVIAFGGGVVGDLSGYAAATYMRGVPLIQIPTTLLAQVDSSVGGKVAVNLDVGKNLVGAFHQPALVLADTGVLDTLDAREIRCGMAEVVKYALLGEDALAPLLTRPEGFRAHIEEIVALCVQAKARFVLKDERDTGARMALNLGHTFGHAIEKYHEYRDYSHGEAVAIGMALAIRAGERLGVTESRVWPAFEALARGTGLDWAFADDWAQIAPLMAGDKKNTGDDVTLVLLKDVGAPTTRRVSLDALKGIFA